MIKRLLFISVILCYYLSINAADGYKIPVFSSIEDVDPIALLKNHPKKEARGWLFEIHDLMVTDTIKVVYSIWFDKTGTEKESYIANIRFIAHGLHALVIFSTSSVQDPQLQIKYHAFQYIETCGSQTEVIKNWAELFSKKVQTKYCQDACLSYPPYTPCYRADIDYRIIPIRK